MIKVSRLIIMILYLVGTVSCTSPKIYSLEPNSGPERTLVNVKTNVLGATVIWDAGGANEQRLSGAYLGGHMFSVPAGAPVGTYQVQLEYNSNRGDPVSFTVTDPVPITAPRLDRISVLSADFLPGNQVNTFLYIQGANVDVDAEVLINGVVVPTYAHKGMQNHLFGVNPEDLAFPIYHHLALIAAPGALATNTQLDVSVVNADGQISNTRQYILPASAATLDSDGDDIPDDWEINGYDADNDGVIDIDLKALGADPLRPDIFLEVDVMQELTNPPDDDVWNAVTGAFANAPIINPTTDDGINLVLDTSGSITHYDIIDLSGTTTSTSIDYGILKSTEFDAAIRGRIYHYGVWGDMIPGGASGLSDVLWGRGGDDFIVTFDNFGPAYQTVQSKASTLMHELGHNLNQRHGGVDNTIHNPTYSSVMSYSWQLRTGKSNFFRLAHNIYSPFYYQADGIVEVNGVVPECISAVAVDYSQGMGRNLVENDLDETVGLYNGNAVYWNLDLDKTDTSVRRSLNLNLDYDFDDTLSDFPNWANIIYTGPRLNGRYP